jgi:hypothetical protein
MIISATRGLAFWPGTGIRPAVSLAVLYQGDGAGLGGLIGTRHEKIFLAKHRKTEWEQLDKTIRNRDAACKDYDEEALLIGIATLVPELHHIDTELPDDVIQLASQRN